MYRHSVRSKFAQDFQKDFTAIRDKDAEYSAEAPKTADGVFKLAPCGLYTDEEATGVMGE